MVELLFSTEDGSNLQRQRQQKAQQDVTFQKVI
jgi:hypothetical protein